MIASLLASSGAVPALQVLVVILPILGALLGAAIGRWSEASNRRRDQYADAVRVLVRWAEYPYRIRRRTSDDPEELRRLTELGHDLQEQLQCHQTWIGAENRRAGRIYADAIAIIKTRTGNAAAEAWQTHPATTAAAMVLSDWGPGSIDDVLATLNCAIANRFGWRRLMPSR
jgi:hypothetical protein